VAERVGVEITGDVSGLTQAARDAQGILASLGEKARTAGEQLASGLSAGSAKAQESLRNLGQQAATTFRSIGDSSKAGVGALSGSMTTAMVASNALLAALDSLVRGFAAPITEILDAEQASAMLKGTFGDLTEEMQKVSALASQLGSQSAFFDDDALSQAAATLHLFGANEKAISELLPYVNNLATAFGVDVNDAAQMVGQALHGQTRALAKMVPEVRGASSQLEVLAALEHSAARNAAIAEERTNGLGGQLGLLKRQFADAAQGLGSIMLPALTQFLDFVNKYMLPALAKMTGAVAGVGAVFGNLSVTGMSGLKDIPKIFSEASKEAEKLMAGGTAVVPRVQRAAAGLAARASGNVEGPLSFRESSGGSSADRSRGEAVGKAQAQSFLDQVRGALEANEIFKGGEAGLRKIFESFGLGKTAGVGVDIQQFQQAKNLLEEAFAKFDESRERQRRQDEASQDRQRKLDDAAAEKRAEAMRAESERVSDILTSASSKGIAAIGKATASFIRDGSLDLMATLREAGPSLAGDVASLIPGMSERGAKVIEAASGAAFDILQAAIDRRGFEERKAREAAQVQLDAAIRQERAAKEQRDAAEKQYRTTVAQTLESQAAREASVRGDKAAKALAVESAVPAEIFKGGLEGFTQESAEAYGRFLDSARGIEKMTDDQVKSFGALSERLIKAGPMGGSEEDRKAFFDKFGMDFGSYGGKEIALALVELAKNMPKEPGTVPDEVAAQGSSKSNPLYVVDVGPRNEFAFAPEAFFFRARASSRAVMATGMA